MAESVSVRIGGEELLEIENLSKIENKSKSNVLREILDNGIKNKKLEIALKKFTNNEVTVADAAKIANLPLTSFMDILSQKRINFHYSIHDLEEDFEGLI